MHYLFALLFAFHAALLSLAQGHDNVRGVIILARNGDREAFYQDPSSYKPQHTDTTPLGAAQSYNLGTYLRSIYLDQSSPSHVRGLKSDLADIKQVYIRSKAGAEGTVCFDSSIALLQGLFPPTQKNKIVLANDSTVVAPLGGYQYIPVETVEPANDRSLESWTNCPAFEKHVASVHASDEFKKRSDAAGDFFRHVREYVYGPEVSLKNIWNVHEFVNTQLIHNKTYAYRLPPTFIEQTRALADFHEDRVFSDKEIGGIGNIAGRTILHSILGALERVAYNGDPLQLFIQQITYQPFISLFHMLQITDERPEFKGIPEFSSAFAIELRKGDEGDSRDFLRFKFRNGTSIGGFQTIHPFGRKGDIPLTEFIYLTENYKISSNREWASVCKGSSVKMTAFESSSAQTVIGGVIVSLVLLTTLFVAVRSFKKQRGGKIRIEDRPLLVARSAPYTDARPEKQQLPTAHF